MRLSSAYVLKIYLPLCVLYCVVHLYVVSNNTVFFDSIFLKLPSGAIFDLNLHRIMCLFVVETKVITKFDNSDNLSLISSGVLIKCALTIIMVATFFV